jgi:signal transduction histidine kinase
VASPRVLGKPQRPMQERPGDAAALRLLSAERTEEIFPILLEEIVKLGFPRAIVLEVDFDKSEVKATASLNFDRNELEKFHTSLWAHENPIVAALERLNPGVLPAPPGKGASFAYPMIYRSSTRCWEAERERRDDCLAVQNARLSGRLPLEGQICNACGMRAYATLLLAQLGRDTGPARLEQLRNLAERANGYLARLFKIEHYFNRMRDMEVTISRLRVAEEVVRQERNRLNLVIENVGDPIVVADNSAKIVLLDSLAKELFGIADGSKHPQVMKNLAKLDAYLTAFTFSFADKDNRSLRLYNPTSQAEVEYAARSGKIYDARGQISYTVTVLRDFTAWRKLEHLQMERRMLEIEKFAATGKLAGTIAHEINNPMEAIKNAIHILGSEIPPDSKQIYDVLKNETERVTRIVRQMLGLYRNVVQFESFDLNGVVEDTLALFARPLSKAGVAVDKRLGEISAFKGSGDQFRQLLSNLVVNSRDSMASGGKLVIRTREIRSTDGFRRWISLSVADTGCGISPEIQKSMFEPFVTTKGGKGTGLGLWIVKGIVENHNGRIRVRSAVGKGTVINLMFPISA